MLLKTFGWSFAITALGLAAAAAYGGWTAFGIVAILAVLEHSAADLPAEVFLEVPSSEDIRGGIVAPPNSTVHWLPRTGAGARPGALALEALEQARLPEGRFSAFTAGESSLATGVRRHLVGRRGVAKADIAFRGYYRHGRASL